MGLFPLMLACCAVGPNPDLGPMDDSPADDSPARGYDVGRSRFMNGDRWVDAEYLANEVQDLVAERDATRPFLLHLHFLDPHMPYTPPAEYLTDPDSLDATDYDLNTEAGTLAL